jgi:succinoglycan biosynthesis protein ExoV
VKLFVYRHPSGVPNFGDELGGELLPRLLPGVFDDDPSTLVLGIGSVLFDLHPADARKIVLGSGYGGYTAPPVLDHRWTVLGVRGKLTCRALGLDAALAVGDPALLEQPQGVAKRHRIAFIPHWQSLARGPWAEVAAAAGVHLIDPRGPVADTLAAIEASELLLAEAMHGAIAADALRVPWVPLAPIDPVHRFKWHDFAGALDLALAPIALAPSSLGERLETIRIAGRAPGRRLLRAMPGIRHAFSGHFVDRAAASLRAAAASRPCLSSDVALSRARERILAMFDRFRRDYASAPR